MLIHHYLTDLDYAEMTVHAVLLADLVRVDAYRKAIENVVRPGMSVAELGAGLGVFGRVAANAGARVTMVEREPSVAHISGLLNSLLSHHAKVTVVEAGIEQVVLPRQDVVVHELIGGRLFDEGLRDLLLTFGRNNPWFTDPSVHLIPNVVSLWCRLVHLAPDAPVHQTWRPGGNDNVTRVSSLPHGSILWATTSSDTKPVSAWQRAGTFECQQVGQWPDEFSVAKVQVCAPANAILWGVTAHLGHNFDIDTRCSGHLDTTWGGSIEYHPGVVSKKGQYTLNGTYGKSKEAAFAPWLREVT